MWLIKNHRTGKFYKTKYDISDDTIRQLHSLPFIKAGAITEDEEYSDRTCLDKWPFIEVIMKFDGRVRDWKHNCEWFTWLVVIDK